MNKVISIIVFIFPLIVLGLSISLVLPVYYKFDEARNENLRLKEQLHKCEIELSTLQQEIHDLEHNPSAVISVAREKFNMQSPNETIIIYH